ncbi:SRPBCC family protein [Oceanibacterium hippocampi]|uniref:Activator of Hsp90 ATPase homologue 1/2-like C-terminal domain-containing protein n=1 Tax=Oceanibacterium hippocampi TaxID=745714 RepID=A0A1Y5SCP0_9PROT|nr:SRPBCC domain-containing protein [Oceanibacterium hippocampi]SLN34581.1 hypothetical protein OCH7691_01344 [Oceanibacterium hippocampi]
MTAATLTRARTAAGELTLTRLIDAPRALVWEVWTDPAHAAHWGPDGYRVEFLTGTAEVGQPWRARLVSLDGGNDLMQGGVFREIVVGERVVYSFGWENDDGKVDEEMLTTVTFADAGDGQTLLTLHQTGFTSIDERDGHVGGWSQAIERLATYAAGLA